MTEEIHSCSPRCERPECVRAERDRLRGALLASEMERNVLLHERFCLRNTLQLAWEAIDVAKEIMKHPHIDSLYYEWAGKELAARTAKEGLL